MARSNLRLFFLNRFFIFSWVAAAAAMSFEAVSILQRLRQRPARGLRQQQRARRPDEAQAAEDQQGELRLSVALDKRNIILTCKLGGYSICIA